MKIPKDWTKIETFEELKLVMEPIFELNLAAMRRLGEHPMAGFPQHILDHVLDELAKDRRN